LITQIGLRLRVLLAHAVYSKLLRMKEGGGGRAKKQPAEEAGDETSDDGHRQDSEETTGTVNSMLRPSSSCRQMLRDTHAFSLDLVGTDIDVITTSLPSVVQLLAVPFKLVVSLVYLYVLLGWR
jgi:hypothetical protein